MGFFCRWSTPPARAAHRCHHQDPGLSISLSASLDGSADEALQLDCRQQLCRPFAGDPRPLFRIGVNFSTKTRGVEKWGDRVTLSLPSNNNKTEWKRELRGRNSNGVPRLYAKSDTNAQALNRPPCGISPNSPPTAHLPEYASAVTLPRISSESVKKMALAQRKKPLAESRKNDKSLLCS